MKLHDKNEINYLEESESKNLEEKQQFLIL
jgi:hypothetical protein